MPKKSKRKNRAVSKTALSAIGILLVCIVAGYFLYRHYHKHSTPTVAPARTIYSNPVPNQNVPGGSNPNSPGGISSSKDGGTQSTTTISPNTQPAAPIGQFVSDHSPNLSGSPAPNTESSTCTTTPGAQCQIRFVSGAAVKSLPAQTTDDNGNTSWSWTLQSVGLTQGTWQVTAVATNGSKTASTSDAIKLVVKP